MDREKALQISNSVKTLKMSGQLSNLLELKPPIHRTKRTISPTIITATQIKYGPISNSSELNPDSLEDKEDYITNY